VYPQPLPRVFAIQPVLDGLQRDQTGPRASFAFQHLAQGQKLAGQVLSQDKGLSLVSVAGQTVAMRLPPGVVTGDTLKLSFAGHMPQPVFLLETPGADDADAPQLSHTARMLSEIMQRVPERTPPTLAPPGPLLDRPTVLPPELALALRTALVRSGLFYESHLANWVAGQDTLEGLLQEPQNRSPAHQAGHATAHAGAAENTAAKTANPLHTLMTQQLQVLESPQFVWKGELWPGQPLEWTLSRTEDETPGNAPEASASREDGSWESSIRITLPQLGALTLHIRLDAQQNFSIRVAPETAGSAPLLQGQQAYVLQRLADAGCTVHSFQVTHEPAGA
jgi:hypothetical protein